MNYSFGRWTSRVVRLFKHTKDGKDCTSSRAAAFVSEGSTVSDSLFFHWLRYARAVYLVTPLSLYSAVSAPADL
ncbi:hypothetical protein BaRGS_00024780 [Batillaria attramentaria]|uniref:Uncharacterized protein n=1 Tax=Batillaria attramentaria TaxID=370345 RepID=A0ABD0K9V6_9CAEN